MVKVAVVWYGWHECGMSDSSVVCMMMRHGWYEFGMSGNSVVMWYE